jgi:hypothetical protein
VHRAIAADDGSRLEHVACALGGGCARVGLERVRDPRVNADPSAPRLASVEVISDERMREAEAIDAARHLADDAGGHGSLHRA